MCAPLARQNGWQDSLPKLGGQEPKDTDVYREVRITKSEFNNWFCINESVTIKGLIYYLIVGLQMN